MEKMEYIAPKFEELDSKLFLGAEGDLDGNASTGAFVSGDDTGDRP